MSKQLLPCPFCGSDDVELSTGYQGESCEENARRYVECIKCAASTEFGRTDEEAIAAWNRRSQPVDRHRFWTTAGGHTACLYCGERFSAVTFDKRCDRRDEGAA
jgi:Lar family restriction alleviation protein